MTDAEWIAIAEDVASWPDRGSSPSDKGMRALAREIVRLRRELLAIRQQHIDAGGNLLDIDEIHAEVEKRRTGDQI